MQVEPEGGVGEGLRVAAPGGDLHRQLQAPFRALRVALGELVGGEGDPDAAAQLVANRVDDPVRLPTRRRVLAQLTQPAPPLFPFEESVLERALREGMSATEAFARYGIM